MALPPTHSALPTYPTHKLLPLVQRAHHLTSYQRIYLFSSPPTFPPPFLSIAQHAPPPSQLYSSLIIVHIIYLERHIVLLAPRAPDHMSTYPLSSACQYPTGPPHTRQVTPEPGILASPRAGSAILT